MEWQSQLKQRLGDHQIAQMSINGSIYTLSAGQGNVIVTNPFKESRSYPTLEAAITNFESNLENPTIVVL